MKQFLIIILAAFTLASCFNEGDASIVAIHVAPSSTSVSSGEKMYFDIHISTVNEYIKTVEIETFDSENGSQNVFSARPETQTFKEKFVYEAIATEADSTFVEFNFRAEDNTGEQSHIIMKIKIMGGGETILPETSGIVLYSPSSGKDDAFSFKTLQPLHSSLQDADLCLGTTSEDAIRPLSFSTKTDITFTKANNFDYASATWSGLQSVFKNSLRKSTVNNVDIDDIIIVGREKTSADTKTIETIGVIRIMAIYDDAGTDSDRIVFNLKTLNKK